jgi:outer membrane lipopolysaccharide assembly protein LptE/RlpB
MKAYHPLKKIMRCKREHLKLSRALIAVFSLSVILSACAWAPPQKKDLPHALQNQIVYTNDQESSSLDSQIQAFLKSLGIRISTNFKQAQAELRILSTSFTKTQPSLADTSVSTTITYTQTIQYQVTNLKNGHQFGPTSVSSTESSIMNAQQIYSSGDLLAIRYRLQRNCILSIFDQLDSKAAKDALNKQHLSP